MITANQIVAHLVGDYVLQSDWMANEKTKRFLPAFVHAATYVLPFLFITTSWKALAVIGVTHALIDRFRLARYLCYAKNFLAPSATKELKARHFKIIDGFGRWVDEYSDPVRWWHPWSECSGTGYHKERPAFLAVWLLIITDNTMHILINGLAIVYL